MTSSRRLRAPCRVHCEFGHGVAGGMTVATEQGVDDGPVGGIVGIWLACQWVPLLHALGRGGTRFVRHDSAGDFGCPTGGASAVTYSPNDNGSFKWLPPSPPRAPEPPTIVTIPFTALAHIGSFHQFQGLPLVLRLTVGPDGWAASERSIQVSAR